jgi:mono/diheme cytochrome c family protein
VFHAGAAEGVAANAAAILTGFAGKILLGEQATNKQKATSYGKPNAPPLDGGSPGQSDGSGDLLPRLLLLDTVTSVGPAKTMAGFMGMPFKALPEQMATFTDILSTWKQGTQNIAQVDGSVKSPFFRNVAASLAVAGDPKMVNVSNAEVSAKFIGQLPPPLYPFGIDAAAANRGKETFTKNCAACHNFAGRGAPLSAGKIAPGLNDATDLVLYTAMLTGPENMPVFSNNQLTPGEKKAIISYIQSLKSMGDPGGLGLARIGPVSEGLVIWVVGIGLLMGVILWIGAKS